MFHLQKVKYSLNGMPGVVRFLESDSRMIISRTWERKSGGVVINQIQIWFGKCIIDSVWKGEKKIPGLDGDCGYTTLCM